MKVRSSVSAAVVLAGLVACNLALAGGDADSNVASQKPVVTSKLVGASEHGFNVFDVSSTTSTSLAGLDVRTKVGYDEAAKRVEAAAKSACEELIARYPLAGMSLQECIEDTAAKAMVRVDAIANSSSRTTIGAAQLK